MNPPITLEPITDGTTFINPMGLVFTLLMCLLILVLPRRYAMLPVVALICYMTMGMRAVFLGLNFTMLRILLLFGWIRLVARGELKSIDLNSFDRLIVIWTIVSVITYTLLWQSADAFKNSLGMAYNVIGFYFMFRYLIRDRYEAKRTITQFAVFLVPLAVCMILEKMSGRNPFALFGGVPAETFVREGVLRCQGPFAHPILAGTFGATLMPLFIGLWQEGENRLAAVLGVASAAILVIASASSGPLLSCLLGALAMALWPFRLKMRLLRWGIVFALGALQVVMKAPIWFVLAKVDIISGSTGYHRAFLIDRAIANFFNWWLVGTQNTWDWADRDHHLFDVTNTYIAEGVNGGMLKLILFITIITLAFKAIGRNVRLGNDHGPREEMVMLWALGAALFAHSVTFISVTYFDQNFVNWYLLLALISTCAGFSLHLSRPEFLSRLESEQSGPETNSPPVSEPLRGAHGIGAKPTSFQKTRSTLRRTEVSKSGGWRPPRTPRE